MTFLFDDGGTVAIDTRLQQGIIALIQPLVYTDGDPATSRGPYLRTLEGIPQAPDGEFMIAQQSEYMRRMPGVLVYVGDGRLDRDAPSGNRARFLREILLVVFSGVAGDAVDGRLDETAKAATSTVNDPGVRVARQHVTELIHRQYPPIEGVMGPVIVRGFMHLSTNADWSSWGIMADMLVDETTCAVDTRSAVPLDWIRTNHDVNGAATLARQKVPVL